MCPSFSIQLVSFNTMISSSIHFPSDVSICFLDGRIRSHCDYCRIFFFTHSSIDGHIGWLHFLAIVSTTAVNMDGQTSLCCVDIGNPRYMPRSGIAGSYGNCTLIFQKLCPDFHSGCISLRKLPVSVNEESSFPSSLPAYVL